MSRAFAMIILACLFCGCGDAEDRQQQPDTTQRIKFEPATVEDLVAARDRFFVAVEARDHDAIKSNLDNGNPKFFKSLAEQYDPGIALNQEPFRVLVYRMIESRLPDKQRPSEADVLDLYLDMRWFEIIFPQAEELKEIRQTVVLGKTKSSRVDVVTDGPIDLQVLGFAWDDGVWRMQYNNIIHGRRQLLNIESAMLALDTGFNDAGELDRRLIKSKASVLVRKLYEESQLPIPEELSVVLDEIDRQWAERP